MVDELIRPQRINLPNNQNQLPIHFHTPRTGGEIIWNNLQYIAMLNSAIKRYNDTVPLAIKHNQQNQSHIPYIDIPPNPTIGYNIHHHLSEFDGGFVFGGSLHDHRDNANGGFAYCVYHPGTNLPKLAYEREEIEPINSPSP